MQLVIIFVTNFGTHLRLPNGISPSQISYCLIELRSQKLIRILNSPQFCWRITQCGKVGSHFANSGVTVEYCRTKYCHFFQSFQWTTKWECSTIASKLTHTCEKLLDLLPPRRLKYFVKDCNDFDDFSIKLKSRLLAIK